VSSTDDNGDGDEVYSMDYYERCRYDNTAHVCIFIISQYSTILISACYL
jgi:hypothetical protein